MTDFVTHAEIKRTQLQLQQLHEHFILLNGNPAALQYLLAQDIKGEDLETWLNSPANLAAFQQLLSAPAGAAAICASGATMAAITASSRAMDSVIASPTAMAAVAASSSAIDAVIAAPTAMAAVIASPTAMAAVAASATAMAAVLAAPNAIAAVAASSSAIDAVIASPAAMTTIAASPAAMAAISATPTAMATILASPTAMTAVSAAPAAMAAISADPTAMAAISAAPTAMAAVIASPIARQALIDNNHEFQKMRTTIYQMVQSNWVRKILISKSDVYNINHYINNPAGLIFATLGYSSGMTETEARHPGGKIAASEGRVYSPSTVTSVDVVSFNNATFHPSGSGSGHAAVELWSPL